MPVTTLTPTPTPQALAEQPDAHGPRGRVELLDGVRADPHETVASLLEARGAFVNGEWHAVLHATTLGRRDDGTLRGEVRIKPAPFAAAETVRYADVALPTDSECRSIASGVRTEQPPVQVPGYYAEEIEQRERVIDACPIDVYSMSISPRWGWPYKLMSYYEARPGAADSAETVIVDSGQNRWGSPDDVLEAAANVDADYVFATDVTGWEDPENRDHNPAYPDPEDYGSVFDAAIEGIRRFIERARELGVVHRTIVPIQPPYVAFLDALDDRGLLRGVSYIAIGGLLDIDDVDERIEALQAVRERVGSSTKVHALAPGTDIEMVQALREQPALVDSLDVSTPERAPPNDKVPDASWHQDRSVFPRGKEGSTVKMASATRVALQLTHMLSPLCKWEKTMAAVERVKDDDRSCDAPGCEGNLKMTNPETDWGARRVAATGVCRTCGREHRVTLTVTETDLEEQPDQRQNRSVQEWAAGSGGAE